MTTMEEGAAAGLTCLVTGATSGIGETLTTVLAARGARVLAVARTAERGTAERGAAALTRIRRRVPDAQVEMLVADLSVLTHVVDLAGQVIARADRLDVAILNAGVARPAGN